MAKHVGGVMLFGSDEVHDDAGQQIAGVTVGQLELLVVDFDLVTTRGGETTAKVFEFLGEVLGDDGGRFGFCYTAHFSFL